MPLFHFFPGLRTDDSLILRIFGEAEFAAETQRVTGTAGFVGTLMIFFAILSYGADYNESAFTASLFWFFN